jgi:hypothetical protein
MWTAEPASFTSFPATVLDLLIYHHSFMHIILVDQPSAIYGLSTTQLIPLSRKCCETTTQRWTQIASVIQNRLCLAGNHTTDVNKLTALYLYTYVCIYTHIYTYYGLHDPTVPTNSLAWPGLAYQTSMSAGNCTQVTR